MLEIYLWEYKIIPFKVLNFVVAEINYGGRVTDNNDLWLIQSLTTVYLCPEALKKNYAYSESGLFVVPEDMCYRDTTEFLNNLSVKVSPELFFLHDNAEIITNENVSREFLENLLIIMSS